MLTLSDDFRLKYREGGWFSSREAGFLVVEGERLPKKGVTTPSLQLQHHCRFIADVLQQASSKCLWVVDCPSNTARKLLEDRFPDHSKVELSMAGYFEADYGIISAYWNIFDELTQREPWNMEQPWTLAGVSAALPNPPPPRSRFRSSIWSLDHVLKNHEKVDSFFVQIGWFAFLGLRKSKYPRQVISREFPMLGPCPEGQ